MGIQLNDDEIGKDETLTGCIRKLSLIIPMITYNLTIAGGTPKSQYFRST